MPSLCFSLPYDVFKAPFRPVSMEQKHFANLHHFPAEWLTLESFQST
jgi:hypothetical protein